MSDDEDVLIRANRRVGSVLHGKYRLDAVLGVGGMAVVYAATHRNQKKFAVKVLHPELSIRSELRSRFLREGYVANSVEHDGVVAVLDDDVDETGAAFLVMELLQGSDVQGLSTHCGGKLPLQAALAVAHQLLGVLEAAHQKAIVHRDIKPANLFVVQSGQVKVLDFGIARLRDATASIQSTRAGAVLGTPAFMAPEQASAQASAIDERTDLWAVGATLFALLSGELVHEGENARQVLIRAATVPARSLLVAAPDTPLSVAALVARALSFDKAARWASAAAMREAVKQAHEQLFGELTLEPLVALLKADALTRAGASKATSVVPNSGLAENETIEAAAPMQIRHADRGLLTTTSKPVATSRPARTEPAPRRAVLLAVAVAAAVLGLGFAVTHSAKQAAQPAVVPAGLSPTVSTAPAAAPLLLPSALSAVLSASAQPAPEKGKSEPDLGQAPLPRASAAVAHPKTINLRAPHPQAGNAVLAPPGVPAPSAVVAPVNPLQIDLQ
ncbi:MAG: serine/threonine-protein kinase [Polyangiaceae bacterium]